MNFTWIAVLLVAALLLRPALRIVIAALFGKSIGKAALDRQPDRISLTRIDSANLRNPARVQSVSAEFEKSGFEDAGLYSIREMKGVSVRLLANRADSMAAAVYEHPAVGVFFDIVSRYVDGRVSTYSSAIATGLKRPDHVTMVNMVGASPSAVLERVRRERSPHGLRDVTPASVGPDFIAAYAEYVKWMKERGVSTSEVIEVARRKAA